MDADAESQKITVGDEEKVGPQNDVSSRRSNDHGSSNRQHSPASRRKRQSAHRRSQSLNSHAGRVSTSDASSDSQDSRLHIEEMGLFDFAEELRQEKPPGEPWFMEMTRLRRLHFLWLNRELAGVRKKILEGKSASDDDMVKLQTLLRDQGTPQSDVLPHLRKARHLISPLRIQPKQSATSSSSNPSTTSPPAKKNSASQPADPTSPSPQSQSTKAYLPSRQKTTASSLAPTRPLSRPSLTRFANSCAPTSPLR